MPAQTFCGVRWFRAARSGDCGGRDQALTALFPDFTIGRRLPDLAAIGVSGVVGWSDLRHRGGARRRAAALGVPFLLFGPGLLRAPPGWGAATPILSVTAHEITGPRSPVDILSPDRLLASSGWESPVLLARAAGLRHEIVSRRLGGPWWNSGADPGLPRGGRHALISGRQKFGQRQWIDRPRAAQRHARGGQGRKRVAGNRACGSGPWRPSEFAGLVS